METNLSCLICFKQIPTDINEGDFNLIKKFLNLLERYLSDGRGRFNYQLLDKLINGNVMGLCGNCLKIVEGFCVLFHDMKTIQLLLNWKVWELEKVFNEGLQPGKFNGSAEEEITLVEWRERMAKQCHQKLLNSFPRLCVERSLQPMKTLEAPIETVLETPVEKGLSFTAIAQKYFDKETFPLSETTSSSLLPPATKLLPENRKQPSKHFCSICFKKFITSGKLCAHYRKEHKNVEAKCISCGKVFNGFKYLKRHQLSRVCLRKYKRPFSCETCDKKFVCDLYLQQHKKAAHAVCQIESNIIASETLSPPQLVSTTISGNPSCVDSVPTTQHPVHANQRRTRVKTKCDNCGKVFNSASSLRCHQIARACLSKGDQDYTKLPFSCDFCQKKFGYRKTLMEHKRVMHEGIRYNCGYCHVILKYKPEIYTHIKKNHKNPSTGTALPFKAKRINVASHEGHTASANGQIPDNIFRNMDNNEDNENDDINENDFVITSHPDVKIFSTPTISLPISKLKRKYRRYYTQNRRNTKEKAARFSCDVCGKGFKHKKGMIKHKENFHEGIRYKCGYCSTIFNYKSAIIKHNKSNHDSLPQKFHEIKSSNIPRNKSKKNQSNTGVLAPSTSCNSLGFKEFDKIGLFIVQNKQRNDLEKKITSIKSAKKLFSCKFCNKTFRHDRSLNRHVQIKHQGIQYRCGYCTSTQVTLQHVENHSLKSHLNPLTGAPLPIKYTIVIKTDDSNGARVNCDVLEEPARTVDNFINLEGQNMEGNDLSLPLLASPPEANENECLFDNSEVKFVNGEVLLL